MNATCRLVRERMGERLSGRGKDSGSTPFDAHFQACRPCSSLRDTLLQVRALAAPLENSVESVLPAFREGVIRAVGDPATASPPRPFPLRAWSLASAAAAAALLLLAFVATWRDQGAGAGPSEEAFRVLLEGQRLVIHWPENGERTHTVSRSTTPSDFSRAKVAVVRGDRWVDSDPQTPGTVFFYLVD